MEACFILLVKTRVIQTFTNRSDFMLNIQYMVGIYSIISKNIDFSYFCQLF